MIKKFLKNFVTNMFFTIVAMHVLIFIFLFGMGSLERFNDFYTSEGTHSLFRVMICVVAIWSCFGIMQINFKTNNEQDK
jgi:hypothetical protein